MTEGFGFWPGSAAATPINRSLAFAAAGSLTAAGWHRGQNIEDNLDTLVASAAGAPLLWKVPDPNDFGADDVARVDRLSQAWVSAHHRYSPVQDRVGRLVVDTDSLVAANSGGSIASDMSGALHALAMPSIQRRFGTKRTGGGHGDIASVAFASLKEPVDHAWGWPLRIAVADQSKGLARRIAGIRAAQHDFVYCEPGVPSDQDLLIVTEPTPHILPLLKEQPLGLALINGEPWKPDSHSAEMVQHWLSGDLAVPTAFIDFGRGSIPNWVNALTYEIAHDKPLDRALFDAVGLRWAQTGGRRMPSLPVIMMPGTDPAWFDGVRLSNRVKDLTARMGSLPRGTIVHLPRENRWSLGIGHESTTVGDYIRDINTAYDKNTLNFGREADGATSIRQLDRALDKAVETLATAKPTAAEEGISGEPGRYTDVTLYDDELFPGDNPAAASQVKDTDPLIAGKPYTLGVAIRLKRTGIDPLKDAPRHVLNPRQDQENLTIYVSIRCECPGVHISDPFMSVEWPYDKDSESAFFRFVPTLPEGASRKDGGVDVLVYNASLDLLDVVHTTLTVIKEGTEAEGMAPRTVSWPEDVPELPHVETNPAPRLASINVSSMTGGFCFEFIFSKIIDGKTKPILVPALRTISAADLRKLLARVRDFWTHLVITNYATKLTVTRTTFESYLGELSDIGKSAARLLFGDNYAAQKGTGDVVGQLLTTLDTAESGTLLQITYSDPAAAAAFVFPWNLLYPPDQENGKIEAFWGVRYQIEQVWKGPKICSLENEPVDVSFILDPKFGNSQEQQDLFEAYVAASAGKLVVSGPIDKAADLFTKLSHRPCSHLYYFFCHGWAPTADGILPADSLKALQEAVGSLPEEQRRFWDSLSALIPKMGKDAWIHLGSSQVEARNLPPNFFNDRRPIIFLNMCQSAALLPSMNDGFVRVFLQRNAAAVVGTESPMTPVFAHAFAREVLGSLLDHKDIGTALWSARRHFLSNNIRNPLGLAYTLYGRATAALGREAIISSSNPTGTASS